MTAVVVGNPKPRSRTLRAATAVASRLSTAEPDLVVDLATIGPALLDWDDPGVNALVEQVGEADVVVFACPTYKGTYTGLLKMFLDRFDARPRSAVAVPLMLGAAPAHALAAELTLRPVLAELGFITVRGHYILDAQHDQPSVYDAWLHHIGPVIEALRPAGVPS